MSLRLEETKLYQYLHNRSTEYAGALLRIRDSVAEWLTYIPQSFPHYTRHTVEHSDEVVHQLSKLLYHEHAAASDPVVKLSGIEAFVLLSAAYLHDAGMVCSDRERMEIVNSDAWKEWTTNSKSAQERLKAISDLRATAVGDQQLTRNLMADVQLRFLVSEFVRRVHHERTARLVTGSDAHWRSLLLDDVMVVEAVANVCRAHGLRTNELDDDHSFPDRRDMRGERVNLRFLAIMLRLADLLDFRTDRACPLLLNAACPLPPDSYAHWSASNTIRHKMVAPDRIEISAECSSQDEHRVLLDWCTWLEEEASSASRLMAAARRHPQWKPPLVSTRGTNRTISIEPSEHATYVFSEWKLQLDEDAVFERLIRDLYDHPLAYVRELVQNALDTNRCRMYVDLRQAGSPVPEYPTQVPADTRENYPVRVALEEHKIVNPLNGETESRQVLVVEDHGMGMDDGTIKRHFLQIGRSYYTTEEFRRRFSFVATSRFGLGFLSVFNVSDQVTVDTFPIASSGETKPLRMTLTGPRKYLLTERSNRTVHGTRIEVLLRTPLTRGTVTGYLRTMCPRVEFPVEVDDLGAKTTIRAERPESWVGEELIPDKPQEKFVTRAFPVSIPGVEGELYVLEHVSEQGPMWACDVAHLAESYKRDDPRFPGVKFPDSIRCFQGILLGSEERRGFNREDRSSRLDYRRDREYIVMGRSTMRMFGHGIPPDPPEIVTLIDAAWGEALSEHIRSSKRTSGPGAWKYLQRLASGFRVPTGFWDHVPSAVPLYQRGVLKCSTLAELRDASTLSIVCPTERSSPISAAWREFDVAMTYSNWMALHGAFAEEARYRRKLVSATWLASDQFVVVLARCEKEDAGARRLGFSDHWLIALNEARTIGFPWSPYGYAPGAQYCLNEACTFVRWLIRLDEAFGGDHRSVQYDCFLKLLSLTTQGMDSRSSNWRDLQDYLQKLTEAQLLPPDLLPPPISLSELRVGLPNRPPSRNATQ